MSKTKSIALIFGVLTMSFLVGYLVLAWTEPGTTPPGGNVPAPLNVGSIAQTKTGSLSFPIFYDSDNTTYYVNPAGTTVLAGNVGIGTTGPNYKLDVQGGQINASGGLCIAGTCKTAWDTVTNYWTASGNNIYNNNSGNVGIGTTAPGYKLDISGDVRWTGTLQGGSVPWARLTSFPSACSSGQYVTAVGSTLTCSVPPAGIGGSGTTNYLAKFTAGTTIGNSQIYDNGTNVGIGTASPSVKLEVVGQVKITGGSPGAGKVLTSLDASGLANWQTPAPAGGAPTGGIIMYSGAWNFDGTGLGTGSLAGWALCNGNNGTPNLSDRFVMGTINSATLGATGGANSYTLTASQLPSHTHTFTTDISGCHTHAVTINSAGDHTHTYGDALYWTNYKNSCFAGASDASNYCTGGRTTRTTSSAGSHSHTSSMGTCGDHSHSGTTASAGSGASIDNRPAFIQLAFIMKL